MSGEAGPHWTAVAVTCVHSDHALFYSELQRRQRAGFIHPDTKIFAVRDPKSRVGSGGATLNALLVVTEHLTALNGQTVVDPEALQDARVLIMHLGMPFKCDPCGKGLTTFAAMEANEAHESLTCNMDYLLHSATRLLRDAPPGVWVCSTEMMLALGKTTGAIDWPSFTSGVMAIAVPASTDYATQHGVYKIDSESMVVKDLIYKGSPEQLEAAKTPKAGSAGDVALVSGLVYFCPRTAEALLTLHVNPPMDACTYIGLDNGAEPLPVSLFLDILKSLVADLDTEAFVSEPGLTVAHSRARALLVERLRGHVELHAAVLQDGEHVYMPNSYRKYAELLYSASPLRRKDQGWADSPRQWSNRAHANVQEPTSLDPSAVVVNSVVAPAVSAATGVVISHCHLTRKWVLGANALLCGVDDSKVADDGEASLAVGDDCALYQTRIFLPNLSMSTESEEAIWTLFGLDDDLNTSTETAEPQGTYCNQTWSELFARTGIQETDLWSSNVAKCAVTARLFPLAKLDSKTSVQDLLWLQSSAGTPSVATVQSWRSAWRLSLLDILSCSRTDSELDWRRSLYCAIGDAHLEQSLTDTTSVTASALTQAGPVPCVLPFFRECAALNRLEIFDVLDRIAESAESPGVAARTLACIADCLGCFAFGKGGLRSGPGRNPSFLPGLHALETPEGRSLGIKLLGQERSNWLDSPEQLIRAARHYESAAQILIRHAVMTARQFITTTPGALPAMGKWIEAETAARIDLAGGWSDTPPITYEHGGAVCNAAIMMRGKRPIGAKAKRIPELHLVLVMGTQRLVLKELDELRNYTQPQAPGALLKAAFCCAKIVTLDSDQTLEQQLATRYSSGFELHTFSNLPHGSGLGTSSILAGAVMAALWRASGVDYTRSCLNHAVCHLEQMLTTGGGWQDQVGGLLGGFKMARSAAQLPLKIEVEDLPVPKEFLDKFSRHLVLVYTGKTRLARNLLQNVLRNWYARSPAIVANVDALTANAEECAKAFRAQDLPAIGACLDKYWTQKKFMAPGCEPSFVRRMMDAMRPHVYGQAMAGAGGGGFMFALSKEPDAGAQMEAVVAEALGELGDIEFYDVAIDAEGLVVSEPHGETSAV